MEEYYSRNTNVNIRNLSDNMPYCIAYCKIIANENVKPEEFIFFEINKAFENIIGLKRNEVIGKRVKELHPIVDGASLDWIKACDKVALDFKTVDFEYYVPFLKKWYFVTAYSNEKYSFSAIFHDITDTKEKKDLNKKWLKGQREYLLSKD